jgi:chromosome segregation ATPase
MKCSKCGYDDMGSGDTAHVCGSVCVRPSSHEIELGRLTKKMNKVKDQRDKARHELAQYKTVLRDLPNLQRRYDEYQKWKKEQETMHTMKTRINEQSLLIERLQKELNARPQL